MARLDKLVVAVDEVLDVIYGTKLERGGYLEIVVPAIKMADKVIYRAEPDSGIDIVVGSSNEATIQKYCGKKIEFVSSFSDDKDLYSREHITYLTVDVDKKKKTTSEKVRELTFYWRLVKKTSKK